MKNRLEYLTIAAMLSSGWESYRILCEHVNHNQTLGIACLAIFSFLFGFLIKRFLDGEPTPGTIGGRISLITAIITGQPNKNPSDYNYELCLLCWNICSFLLGYGAKACLDFAE